MRKAFRQLLAGSLMIGFAVDCCAAASGVSPYLPLNLSPEIELQIERVLILADKPVLTRPIAAATVLDALPAACEVDEVLCRRVRRYLNRYTARVDLTHGSLEAAVSGGTEKPLPNQRGMTTDSAWQASLRGQWQPNAYALLSLGAVGYDGDVVPSGSMLSLGFEYAQLDIGYRDQWLSPFTQSAMLLSTNAETMPSVTLSNYAPITPLGLTYLVFLAEMDRSDRIRFGDGFTSGNPRLAGLHLAIEPVPGWSLSANRIFQFGGGERGGDSLSDFWRALTNAYEYDNTTAGTRDSEFGNQLAAFTSRFIFPGPTPFTVYFEYAGEDTSYDTDYRLGNASLSAGISFPKLWNTINLTYEVSEWQNGWYVHGIYRDGLTNGGNIIGHWGADARLPNHGVNARTRMLQIGWEPPFGGLLQLRGRRIVNGTYSGVLTRGVVYQPGYDITASYSRSFAGFTAGVEIMSGDGTFGSDSYHRIAGFVRFGDEWANGTPSLFRAERPAGAELFVDAGINSNRVRITLDAISVDSGVKTARETAPHFAIGARRAVSKRNDLGARIEYDSIDGADLWSVRALDYRYRFDSPLAITAFLGASRYSQATAAFGYYGGVGLQWRNILPRVDLGVDVRYADKVQRDKIVPGEAPLRIRPDAFYDISSYSVYLSYKW